MLPCYPSTKSTMITPNRSITNKAPFQQEQQSQEESCGAGTRTAAMKNGKIRARRASSFPLKLYKLLEDTTTSSQVGDDEEAGNAVPPLGEVVSWLPGGHSFRVHRPKVFSEEVLPLRFRQTKYKSFLRQLNIYGFQRIQHGPNKGGYAHHNFVRGYPELCQTLVRLHPSNKGNPLQIDHAPTPFDAGPISCMEHHRGVYQNADAPSTITFPSSDALAEPRDFLGFGWQAAQHQRILRNYSSIMSLPTSQQAEEDILGSLVPRPQQLLQPMNMCNAMETISKSPEDDEPADHSHTRSSTFDDELAQEFLDIIRNTPLDQEQEEPSFSANDRYDAARGNVVPQQEASTFDSFVASQGQKSGDLDRSESTFPSKLYRLLQDVEEEGNTHIVCWIKGGTAFQVYDIEAFMDKILVKYFDMGKYASFRRQVNLYGFSRGIHEAKTYFQHPCFVRHDPSLCEQMTRTKPTSERRKRRASVPVPV